MEWGYVILVFFLTVTVIISLVLILLPLLFYHKSEIRHGVFGKVRLIVYFFALGIAFLFLGLLYLTVLPELFAMLIGLPFLFKSIVSLILIAPLAFAMGIPFPVGVAYLAEENDTLIPWAWGINGAASVISAIPATLLAIHLGFTIVALVTFPKR